jgi:hypothetical protein
MSWTPVMSSFAARTLCRIRRASLRACVLVPSFCGRVVVVAPGVVVVVVVVVLLVVVAPGVVVLVVVVVLVGGGAHVG